MLRRGICYKMEQMNNNNKEIIPTMIQHFMVWRCFNDKVYHSTLTSEDVIQNGNEKYIDQVYKVSKSTSGTGYQVEEDVILNTKCVFLEKHSVKYILPSNYQKHLPLEPDDCFECYLKPSDKTIYKFITKPYSVGITPEQTISFKELINLFNPITHTNLKVNQFLKIQAIGSKAKGGKYRLCGPPSSGKNANDVILNMIFNDNIRVSKPSLAKLETLFYYNQKVLPDEMTSLTTGQVRDVEPFFLTIADENPVYTKHSMAQKKDLNTVDLSKSSCVFTYNDIPNIAEGSKFFDDLWQSKEAFDSRYPSFLIDGEITTSLTKLSIPQAKSIMEQHFEVLRLVAKNVSYYINHMDKELHWYDRNNCKFVGRHRVNIECILDALDVYSDTQLEFDGWLDWLWDKNVAYQQMVKNHVTPIICTDEEEVI